MNPIEKIIVSINFGNGNITVGTIAINNGDIYFQYENNFIKRNLHISPYNLPLKSELIKFNNKHTSFEGLGGAFNDSLPDGWGRLLLDRYVRSQGIDPNSLSPLDRLASIGSGALGALVYEPEIKNNSKGEIDLDVLSDQSKKILNGSSDEVINKLLSLNGSSAGARPKILVGSGKDRQNIIHNSDMLPNGFENWIIKFTNSDDGIDAGAIEYVYAIMAKKSGINMPDTHLFPAKDGPGYFGIKRFDRNDGERYHMHTVCGLLNADFRTPTLDYEDLLNLTFNLTKDAKEVQKMYRLAVFNVLAYNRDDHSKNFSFLMNSKGQWVLSPGYDLTYSSGINGQQSMMVMGQGDNISIDHLIELAKSGNIKEEKAQEIIKQIQESLSQWEKLANKYSVRKSTIKSIKSKITY